MQVLERIYIMFIFKNYCSMRSKFNNTNHKQTQFIQLNTIKCKACWKCTEKCPAKVFRKIDLPWHKHVVISNGEECTGCLKCVKACEYNALNKI